MRNFSAFVLVLAAVSGCNKTGSSVAAAGSAGTTPAASTSSSGTPAASSPAAGATGQAQPPATPVKPVPAQLPDVLATVDGEKIERWELEGAIKGMEARAGSPIPADRRDEIMRGLLDQIVSYHVLHKEAVDRKVAATDAEVEDRLKQIKGGFPNEQAFQQALTAQGISLAQLQQQTRMGMSIDKVIQTAVGADVKVEDTEVSTFYQQNQQQFAQDESVHASHILIGTPQGADAKAKEAAKAKAEQVLKQLKSGGDFVKLAKEQSQDPGSATGGGDLGFFPKGQTDPAFEKAAFALKDGALSDVVETQFGYHVIKVHEHRAARTAPLDEVSDQIRSFLTNQKRDAGIQTFIEQSKAKRKVQILV